MRPAPKPATPAEAGFFSAVRVASARNLQQLFGATSRFEFSRLPRSMCTELVLKIPGPNHR